MTAGLWWFGAVLATAIIVGGMWWSAIRTGFAVPAFAIDYNLYRTAAERWLSGDGFYLAYQLAGPYSIYGHLPILYPPTVLALLIPFTVLPAVLWWAIPTAIVAGVLRYHRTRPAALLVIAGLLAWPTTSVYLLWTGNPVLWACTFLALATIRPGLAPLVLLKPTLGPFALWGIGHREWWVGLAVFALLSAAFLPMWVDYATVIRNSDGGLLYSLWNVPLMLVPVVGWLGRSTAR
jgi:hypothetical protein